VRGEGKGPQIVVSRSHPEFIRALFELEVPELVDGDIEIKAIAREAGHRTKIAVASHDPNIDPVGACVGARGSRVRQVVNELKGEKVDIVEWEDDSRSFIAEALSPARVQDVQIDEEENTAIVIVPDHQLSLAIGKEGQNARLAARLSGYRIDIRSESQELGLDAEEEETEFETVAEGDGAGEAEAESPAEDEPAAEVATVEVATGDEPAAEDATDSEADEPAAADSSATDSDEPDTTDSLDDESTPEAPPSNTDDADDAEATEEEGSDHQE
jgi:N utilization substance protein A